MRIIADMRNVFAGGVLAVAVAIGFATSSSVHAGDADITLKRGVVDIQRGTVVVLLADGTVVEPSNGHGLLIAGVIQTGDVVKVRIVGDSGRRREHRGHVTVLK